MLTLVMTLHNEEEIIGRYIEEIKKDILGMRCIPVTFLILDNASTDNTYQCLRDNGILNIIRNTSMKSYGKAVEQLLSTCNSQYIFFTDGDGQYEAYDLWRLYIYRRQYDIVSGKKEIRYDSAYRIVFSKVYNILISSMLKIPFKDLDCGFILMNDKVKELLPIQYLEYSPWTELLVKAYYNGYKIKQVCVSHRPRLYGKPKLFKIKDVFLMVYKQLIGLLKLWKKMYRK